MNSSKTRTLPPLNRVSPSELEHALLQWDEFDEASLITLASHPQSAERLRVLREAERWLAHEAGEQEQPVERSDLPACPPAEELFDFGRGPGFAPLPMAGREAIEVHLTGCSDCEALVASLATPPPLPVNLDQEEEDIQKPDRRPTPARALRLSRTWVPFLVAAGLAGVILLPPLLRDSGASSQGLPQHPVYRGAESGSLLFPRGKILAGSSAPEFELTAIENTSVYRIEVYAHGAGAFDEGQRVQVLYSSTARFEGEALAAGTYTWRAFAEINELDKPLGSLEFEVVEQAPLGRELAHMMDANAEVSGAERIALIRKLEEQGFQSDARKLAQLLPETPDKREFLRTPGR